MVLAHNTNEGKRTQDIEISVDVTFDSMFLSHYTLEGLKNTGFYKPSPIQLHAIPLGKCGFDLFLEAKSGTGKTVVFTVIALENVNLEKGLQAIILAPTREIAAQISDVIKQIGTSYTDLNVEVVMGGLPVEEDIQKLQGKVHILVGSPGRMRHLIHSKHIDVTSVRLLVLDEADKLMDKSFIADINYIFSVLPKQKQVIMSSATYPDTLMTVMQNYVQKVQHICPDSTSILLGIKQYVTTVKSNINIVRQTRHKFEELLKILSNREFKQCLIFCNYQVRVGELCKMLIREKWPADQLHGQLEQMERLCALKTLQEYKCRILVSTDLAARGIDASNVDLVIHFEPPNEWQTYLHRIGRAGRFGSYGIAITILSEGKEVTKFKQMLTGISHSLKVHYLWTDEKFEIDDCDSNHKSTEQPMIEILESSQIKKEKCEISENDKITITPQMEETYKTTVDKFNKIELEEISEIQGVEKSGAAEKLYEDFCNDLVLENNEDQSLYAIFNTFETSEQFKVESFNELMTSFTTQKPNNNKTIEIQDASCRYSDSMSNIDTQSNIILDLHTDTSHRVEVLNSTAYSTEGKSVPKTPTYDHNEKQPYKDSSVAKTSDLSLNMKQLMIDSRDLTDLSTTNQNALINAGLPTSFGSKKFSNKRNKSKVRKDREQISNKQISNVINNPSEKHNSQTSSKVLSVRSSSGSGGSATSFYDDGYNTQCYLYSKSTKSEQSRSKKIQNCMYTISSETHNNIEIESDTYRNYTTWCKQLKIHVAQIEMSLYMNELSNI